MSLREQLQEAFISIKLYKLRSGITIGIIAIGIIALIAILTAIDAIQYKINTGFQTLGAGSFEIYVKGQQGRGGRHGGGAEKRYPVISETETKEFTQKVGSFAQVGLTTSLSSNAVIRFNRIETNPNIQILGINHSIAQIEKWIFKEGRAFTVNEDLQPRLICILGFEVAKTLSGKSLLHQKIFFLGKQYFVVGILEKAGSMFNGKSTDRKIFLPLAQSEIEPRMSLLNYSIKVEPFSSAISDIQQQQECILAMRYVRHLKPFDANNFEVSESSSVNSSWDEIHKYLQIGGFLIGFVTMIGAAIGLLNIMLVAVTERIQEIGIRKSLGATPQEILVSFLLEAILICQFGGFIGIILGVLIGNITSVFLGTTSLIIPWMAVSGAFLLCLFTGILAGYFPARRASKVNPIDSLRFE